MGGQKRTDFGCQLQITAACVVNPARALLPRHIERGLENRQRLLATLMGHVCSPRAIHARAMLSPPPNRALRWLSKLPRREKFPRATARQNSAIQRPAPYGR